MLYGTCMNNFQLQGFGDYSKQMVILPMNTITIIPLNNILNTQHITHYYDNRKRNNMQPWFGQMFPGVNGNEIILCCAVCNAFMVMAFN